MPERLLTQHFLQRFLENDLVSPDADRHQALAMVGGGLLTSGLFISMGISLKFLFMPFQSPGRTALAAVDDRFLFIFISMVLMALMAVAAWDALSLDPRDTAILGPLPIGRGVIVRAKLRAVSIMAAGFAVAVSGLPSVVHPALMVAKLPMGLLAGAALMAIHLIVTFSAGLFAFASIVALRELFRALLGARFTHVSAGLQAALIVSLITAFLLLPAIAGRASRWGPEGARVSNVLPALWFLGLHEAMAGSLVLNIPHDELPRGIRAQEERALAQYTARASTLTPLAGRAVAALGMSLALAIAGFYWNSRHLPLPLVGGRASAYRGRGVLSRAATFALVRTPAAQGGFFFTLQCLFRSAPHRVVMAGCTAVSLALAIVLLAPGPQAPARDIWRVPGSVFSTQTTALVVLLAGFRHIMRLPADVRGNRLFRLAWLGESTAFVHGVRLAAMIAIVLPVVTLLLPAHLYLLGPRIALMHLLSGILLGAALLSVVTYRCSQLPLVASYMPSGDLNTVGPIFLITTMIGVSLFARIERAALADPQTATMFWAVLLAVAVIPPLIDGRNPHLDLPSAFDVPTPGATRLDLG